MAADTMLPVAHLLPDILAHIHVLLYQVGAFAACLRLEGHLGELSCCTSLGLCLLWLHAKGGLGWSRVRLKQGHAAVP